MAVRNGNLKVASYLLSKGAEFNGADSSGNSAVHYAAAYGFSDCIDVLVQAGADQNAVNTWKLTPLCVALSKGHFGVVKKLLNFASTDVNCKDDEGRTLVSSSISKFNQKSFEEIRFLIEEKRADVTIKDLKNRSALYYATMLRPSDIHSGLFKSKEEKDLMEEEQKNLIFSLIELLVSKGADVNEQDDSRQTPLTNAL
jgi:ankyrin repeat protein